MKRARLTFPVLGAVVAAAMLLPAAPVDGQATVDSAAFIVRLGHDTVAVERWIRTTDRLEAVSVSRSPRTVVRRYTARLGPDGRVTHVTVGEGPEREVQPPDAIPIAGGFYAPYALAVQRAVRDGGDLLIVPMLVGQNARDFRIRRLEPNEYMIPNQFDVRMTVRVGPGGRVDFIDAGGGSTVERVAWFDIDAMAREFAARDERGAGLGPLSPRDTARAQVGGATVLVDYSRPSARGRTVMGGLVPLGEVWRTGANDATQLVTDRALRIGDLELAPGSYSLLTIPGRDAWQLIVNRRTGVSGLDHDPAQDVGRVPMQVRTLAEPVEQFTILVEPEGSGGVLRIRWGTTEAYVPVTTSGGEPSTPAAAAAGAPGRLVIVGGGLSRDTEPVYRAVLDGRAGAGPLCVIPTAGADAEGAIASAVATFERHGGARVAAGIAVTTDSPEAARDPAVVERLLGCSGFYFTGGVQSRIVDVFRPSGRDTPAYTAIRRRHAEGAVVAGSSAGAAIMSDPMIAGGNPGSALAAGVRRVDAAADDGDDVGGAVLVATGLGFLPAIVDQHFLARGRIGRLVSAVLDLPEFDVGFGIDENTALVVEEGTARVAGESGVVVLDARTAVRDGRSATGVALHLLGPGDRFDLESGTVRLDPAKAAAEPPAESPAPADPFARWAFLHLLHSFATSGDASLDVPFDGGSLTLRRGPGLVTASRGEPGVQGTPAGLGIAGLLLDVRR